MSVPKNVFWFEILLYAALTLDALSVALQDRGTLNADIVNIAMFLEGGLILVQFYFVWLAGQRRVGWPRWALAALLLLSVISLLQTIGAEAVNLVSAIEIVSCALSAVGLALSFTGNARGWFNGLKGNGPQEARRSLDERLAGAWQRNVDRSERTSIESTFDARS